MHAPSRASIKLEIVATIVFACLGLSPAHADSLLSPPDISECHSDTPWVGECLPLRRGETLAIFVEVDNRSEQGVLDAPLVERIAIQVLTEGLRAPSMQRERPRADVTVVGQVIQHPEIFAWAPENRASTMTVLCNAPSEILGLPEGWREQASLAR